MLVGVFLLESLLLPAASALDTSHYSEQNNTPMQKRQSVGDLEKDATWDDWNGVIPLKFTNLCEDTIWPALLTQNGNGPTTGGFELQSGKDKLLWTGENWEGRIWGRTNCTVNGESASCKTGDCGGKISCSLSVSATWLLSLEPKHANLSKGAVPATLTEITLIGGINKDQSFYDISLVDGYNIPMAVKHIPPKNASKPIPPNLTNPACIATAGWIWEPTPLGTIYGSAEYPIPWEIHVTNQNVRRWCPWDQLAFPPDKPGDGIFPYPDDNVPRTDFSPCLSRCSVTNAPKDCCTGKFDDPKKCKPSLYSRAAKAMCPDAYSFAYDDHLSTFAVPKGGGFEVIFCPEGRSTNILATLASPLSELAANGVLSDATLALLRNSTYIRIQAEEAAGIRASLKAPWLVLGVALAGLLPMF